MMINTLAALAWSLLTVNTQTGEHTVTATSTHKPSAKSLVKASPAPMGGLPARVTRRAR
jgi:hypothetical protein